MNYRLGDFRMSEKVSAEIVSLPMFPHLTAEQQVRVVDEIRKFRVMPAGSELWKAQGVEVGAGERAT